MTLRGASCAHHRAVAAKLERTIVDRSATGLRVTALRVTVLDGTGAVLNLGRASMAIRSAGR